MCCFYLEGGGGGLCVMMCVVFICGGGRDTGLLENFQAMQHQAPVVAFTAVPRSSGLQQAACTTLGRFQSVGTRAGAGSGLLCA